MLGELREHPDWAKFQAWMQKTVDNYRSNVVVAAREKSNDLADVREAVGGLNAVEAMQRELQSPAVDEDPAARPTT